MIMNKLENKIDSRDIFLNKSNSDIILPTDFLHLRKEFWDGIFTMFNEVIKLPHNPNEKLNVIDLDDTIYSRFNQLQLSLLNENRGEEWNKVIREIMWGYEKFCEMFYKDTQAVPEFVDMIKNQNSMILTAWRPEFQEFKLKNIWSNLDKADRIVVDSSKQKPAYLLLYIIYKLWYIPWEINIYDDRVKYFKEHADFLSKLLKTDININEVILSAYDTTKIESINQSSYLQTKLIK